MNALIIKHDELTAEEFICGILYGAKAHLRNRQSLL